MPSKNAYLRLMLEAGSSRVFNCVEKRLRLCAENAADTHFFKHESLHNVIIIKEAAIARSAFPLGRRLATKLYFPYNSRDPYEGGRSIFFHDPKLLEVLNEVVGLQGKKLQKESIQSDLKILQVMDGLSSLDAFLMRDALELEGLSPNLLYLEVSNAERAEIHEFIRNRFEPLVRAAFGGGTTNLTRSTVSSTRYGRRVIWMPSIRSFKPADFPRARRFGSSRRGKASTFTHSNTKGADPISMP